HLSQSDEVLKFKNFKKDATLKLSKSTNQEYLCSVKSHRVPRHLWGRIKLLMQGTSLTKQELRGRQTSFAAGTSRNYTPGASGSNSGKQSTVICYNCKGEGHMSRQCTKPNRKRDDSWFKEKVLLVQAQAHGQILNEKELAFLADPDIPEGQGIQTVIITMLLIQ
ncbi:retrovirus-related pol polyprotein from transposon TNT 1-94, partial [Tanacetum coccineum]